MQLDAVSGRARECLGPLVSVLGDSDDEGIVAAVEILAGWDGECLPDSVGPTLFNVFYRAWCRRVAEVRFEADEVELMAKGVEPLAGRLLGADPHGWFADEAGRKAAIESAMSETLEILSGRLGEDISGWSWGRLHLMPLRHVLSGRGSLGELLDHGGAGVRGDMLSVGNTGLGPDWEAASGAGYRHVVDLAEDPAGLWTIDGQGQSGQPGSPHYDDQYDDWLEGRLRFVPLGPEIGGVDGMRVQQLEPAAESGEGGC
jgi:penicillin amidase